MTGAQLAHKISAPPFVLLALQNYHSGDKERFKAFLEVLKMRLENYFSDSELQLDDVPRLVIAGYPGSDLAEKGFPVIVETLKALGRYQSLDDDMPWNAEYGSCSECLQYQEGDPGNTNRTHVCAHCNRRFWKFNSHLNLWQQVTGWENWDRIRFDITGSTPVAVEEEESIQPESERPMITILATWFQEFDHFQRITQLVPAKRGVKAGATLDWELAQFGGRLKVVSCSLPKDGFVECILQKIS